MDKNGFTLTELLVTVAIIGILAAIAIPSYTAYVQRGRMAQAYADVQTIALANEKNFSINNAYAALAVLQNTFGAPGNTNYYTLDVALFNGNMQFVASADRTANSNSIRRRPCMRSDGVQGYTAAVPPANFADCIQEEWRGR